MQTRPIQLTDVIYNAATQCFEALVTVHDGDRSCKYPCAINAPINMTFEDAAKGLETQAVRRHNVRTRPSLQIMPHVPPQRAGRPSFDPVRWLESIVSRPDRRIA
jgi:hypothetical protein